MKKVLAVSLLVIAGNVDASTPLLTQAVVETVNLCLGQHAGEISNRVIEACLMDAYLDAKFLVEDLMQELGTADQFDYVDLDNNYYGE